MSMLRPRGHFNPPAKLPRQFVFDAWYVAAWGEEISRQPLRRVLLDEPVVFYRRVDGKAVALADRCVHRGYPLSRGEVRDDEIVCGYHGFRFDPCGVCTWVPGQDNVPKSARVRAFPLIESGPFVWIWMGDPQAADPACIPDHHWADDPAWSIIKDRALVNARYAILLDNLMDLSHETWVHAATIGTAEVADTPIRVEIHENIIRCFRHIQGATSPPFYQSLGMSGTIDRWQDIEFNVPAFYALHVRIAPHGGGDDVAFFTKIMYALTPETAHTTHDYWVIARSSRVTVPDWQNRAATAFQNRILNEDVNALEALEANLPAHGEWQELSIKNDTGGIAWRRIFSNRLTSERERNEVAPVARVAIASPPVTV